MLRAFGVACGQSPIERLRRTRPLAALVFAIFTLFTFVAYLSILSGPRVNVVPDAERFSLYDARGDLIRTPTCRIPDFDAHDPLVRNLFLHETVRGCPKLPQFFIGTKIRGSFAVPVLDTRVLWRYYRIKERSLSCLYQPVVRNEEASIPDNNFVLLNRTKLKFGEYIGWEYIWIECFRFRYRTKFYSQPLLLAVTKNGSGGRGSRPVPRSVIDAYNVIVLGYDSVSRLNFHRLLPKSHAFLTARSQNVVELLGFNKVGLNSGPNQVPLLSGKRFKPDGLYEEFRHNFVDNMTRFIWEDFYDAGYSTLFFEEQWTYGLFVWPDLKGFRTVPTDYWPRPLMQLVDASTLKERQGNRICIGPRVAVDTYLDYVLDLLRTSTRPLWMYPWFSELSHNTLSGAGRADASFVRFFDAMEREGFLNSSVVFFVSDHGFRFGELRHTPLGRFEDQLPFGYVLFPAELASRRPTGVRALRINAASRLVTTYDIHATMLELAQRAGGARRPLTRTEHGYSLLSETVPANRTCVDAGIDIAFCSCYTANAPAAGGSAHENGAGSGGCDDSELCQRLGQKLIDWMNSELDRYNDTRCVRWWLANVTEASPLFEGKRPLDAFRVAIEAAPGGRFEAVVAGKRHRPQTVGGALLSSVDRTDWYSEHAHCVMPSPYERYCYCR